MATSIVGLDIGNGVLRAAEIGDPQRPKPTLLRYHSIALPPSVVDRGEVVELDTVASALKQLWATAGFKSKKVVLGMGNHRVLVRDLTVPKMPLPQIKESLPYQVQDLLPVPVADALLDFYPTSVGTGENGEVINGLLVAAVRESVLRNVEAVQRAGLDPVEVDLVPFALSRSLLAGSDGAGLVALVHIGAVMTSVIVAKDGVPQFVRIIQSGSDEVTSVLVERLGVERAQAEQIKRGIGLSTEGIGEEWRPAVDAIAESVGELLDNVRNTLSYFVNTRRGAVLERVLLSGGGGQLRGIGQALAEATSRPVGAPTSLDRFTVAKSVVQDSLQADPSGLAVAAGLALGSRS